MDPTAVMREAVLVGDGDVIDYFRARLSLVEIGDE
jgi:hypothetical protein